MTTTADCASSVVIFSSTALSFACASSDAMVRGKQVLRSMSDARFERNLGWAVCVCVCVP
jgi:hypothetical protein